ncbi:MAG: hypothetical protein HY364_03690 [Candidatus Aenigmarchaeota archaeon]|nr:hypothetical protein [Candidatus Aenigmarchaeota archaeon]
MDIKNVAGEKDRISCSMDYRALGLEIYINFGWDGDSIWGPYHTMQDVHNAALSFPKGRAYDVVFRSVFGQEDAHITYTRGREMLEIEEPMRTVTQSRRVIPSVYCRES